MLLGAKTCPQYCRLQKCLHCHGRSYDCSSRRSGPTVGATVKGAAFTFRCPDYRLQQYVVEYLEQKYHSREEVYGSICCHMYTYAGKKLHSCAFIPVLRVTRETTCSQAENANSRSSSNNNNNNNNKRTTNT